MSFRVRRDALRVGGWSACRRGGAEGVCVCVQEVALLVTRASKAELALHQQQLRQGKLDSIEVRPACPPTTCAHTPAAVPCASAGQPLARCPPRCPDRALPAVRRTAPYEWLPGRMVTQPCKVGARCDQVY